MQKNKVLHARATLLSQIRQFFAKRNVLEVETPLLYHTGATDPFLNPIKVSSKHLQHSHLQTSYLQTSPEYAMKRLLAMGSGCIYQICKAFRGEESGHLHNPEFTMLEWYRVSFTHFELMDEVDMLLQETLNAKAAERRTYQELFNKHFAINPHTASLTTLTNIAAQHNILIGSNDSNDLKDSNDSNDSKDSNDSNDSKDSSILLDKDDWLNLLMTHCIEPTLGHNAPVFVYDYPASQAALAKVRDNVAERFEVYIKGIELGNGYHELTDAAVQRERFLKDAEIRKKLNREEIPMDEKLIAALTEGLPDCAGIALGLDRLLMLKLGVKHIDEVLLIKS